MRTAKAFAFVGTYTSVLKNISLRRLFYSPAKKGSAYIIFTEISAKQLPYLFALFDKKYYNKWRLKG